MEDSEYLISDFIEIQGGTPTDIYGSIYNVAHGDITYGVTAITYTKDKVRNDYWGRSNYATSPKFYRQANVINSSKYIRVHILKKYYDYAKIIQNGKVLFDGSNNPPDPKYM